MSIRDKVVEIANKAMRTKAHEILQELKDECPRSAEGHNGKHVADSFHIMAKGSDAEVFETFNTGNRFIKTVVIGSNEKGAYFANYGNGGHGKRIYPKNAKALHLKDGSYKGMVHGYEGKHFIEKVAKRHNGSN